MNVLHTVVHTYLRRYIRLVIIPSKEHVKLHVHVQTALLLIYLKKLYLLYMYSMYSIVTVL